jgi:hypothetical protein
MQVALCYPANFQENYKRKSARAVIEIGFARRRAMAIFDHYLLIFGAGINATSIVATDEFEGLSEIQERHSNKLQWRLLCCWKVVSSGCKISKFDYEIVSRFKSGSGWELERWWVTGIIQKKSQRS